VQGMVQAGVNRGDSSSAAKAMSRRICVMMLYLPDRTSCTRLLGQIFEIEVFTVVSARLNVVKGLKRTIRIVSFGRS
jgi:hypothetical protein